jgi:hypothetical protein
MGIRHMLQSFEAACACIVSDPEELVAFPSIWTPSMHWSLAHSGHASIGAIFQEAKNDVKLAEGCSRLLSINVFYHISCGRCCVAFRNSHPGHL